MGFFTSLIAVLSTFVGMVVLVFAKENIPLLQPRQGGNFVTSYWVNDFATADYINGPAGQFSIDWNNGFGGDFVIGKGYSASSGPDFLFNYSGTFDAHTNANAYLALYGWTTNPLVEFYVIESMGVHNPSDNASATQYGLLESDGGTYEIWQKQRTNAPSIIGTATFQQYWSIRTKMHCGGTINTGNHFRAWEAAGLPLGTYQDIVLAIEGQQGSGSANLTVGILPTTSPLETPTSTQRTQTYHYSTHYTSTTTTSSNGPTSQPASTNISAHITSIKATSTGPASTII